eukprot:CAMPEP_0197258814 /NCGR_PEP_ID=MMETSP1429-20130617/83196_1 /TAXON_ID=49237 /ORGANISM="Chaetoceros  sp., Strain UNC1202" /LENGTH=379 /DNA_ID=CAMNT_0042722999 /DNA_START=88 /DNA_END=1227 /DNA_ORIENTATION=-
MPRPDLNSEDYYAILGCNRKADDSTLKKAYRKLAVKWHPDKNPDNDEATKNFQKISEAYAVLSDAQKRKMYDQFGKEGANAADNMPEGGMPGGMGGFPGFGGGMPSGGGGGAMHMSPEEAQQFFGSMFGSDDPFGGLFGMNGGGMPGGVHVNVGSGGMPGGGMGGMPGGMPGGMDPFSMMFGGGMPGGMGAGMHGMPSGFGGMPSQFPPQKPPPQRYDVIPPRTVISLKGLVNSPERNGDQGVIQEYNPIKERYRVQFEDSQETMYIKASNMLQHVHVRIHDVKSQPELNGKTGTIITWLPAKQRYNIHVSELKKVVSLRPANVVLDTGTVGQIDGLKSKPELNGKWGTIKGWIRDSNKYDVQLSQQQVIRIKAEYMRV